MREILFRGKRIDNGEWAYGGYRKEKIGEYPVAVFIIEHLTSGVYENHRVDCKTVGQYTGLTDKNGNKIFEGDIVRFPDSEMFPSSEETINEGFVDWDEETMCFYFTNRFVVDMEDFYVDNGKMVDVVVIGNIHDNPEFLKGGGEE